VIRESVAGYIIQDLDTKNGTFVNEEAIERSLLFHSDAVVIGGYTLKFLEEDEQDVSNLDSGFVAPLPSGGLKVPSTLSARGPDPRARTAQRPGERTPERANRLNREREAARRAASAVAEVRRTPQQDASEGPLVEGIATGSRSGRKTNFTLDFSLSEFDSGGDDQSDPRFAPPDTARERATDRRREAQNRNRVHGPARSGKPEIRELSADGVRFNPAEGTTSCGFGPDDDISLGSEGVGTLFTVRRRGPQMQVRSGSSLRPVLLNGAPVVSAEAFPGDVFEVDGRRFEILLTVGRDLDVVPSAVTVLGINSNALEAEIQARLAEGELARSMEESILRMGEPDPDESVPPPFGDADRSDLPPAGPAVAKDGVSPIGDDPRPDPLMEEDDEWAANSLRTAQSVSALAATRDGPPVVHELLLVEAAGASHPGQAIDVAGDPGDASWADDWLGSGEQATAPSAGDTLRTAKPVDPVDASGRRRRKRAGAPTQQPPSFLPPVTNSDPD
jgi:pSer/pThr/pTyr-binding forkhead associated (FHA) protein